MGFLCCLVGSRVLSEFGVSVVCLWLGCFVECWCFGFWVVFVVWVVFELVVFVVV